MRIFKSKVDVPNCASIITIDTGKVWMVYWYSRYGEYRSDTKKRAKPFFNDYDATVFMNSLNDANKLIGNTAESTRVWIEKQ